MRKIITDEREFKNKFQHIVEYQINKTPKKKVVLYYDDDRVPSEVAGDEGIIDEDNEEQTKNPAAPEPQNPNAAPPAPEGQPPAPAPEGAPAPEPAPVPPPEPEGPIAPAPEAGADMELKSILDKQTEILNTLAQSIQGINQNVDDLENKTNNLSAQVLKSTEPSEWERIYMRTNDSTPYKSHVSDVWEKEGPNPDEELNNPIDNRAPSNELILKPEPISAINKDEINKSFNQYP